MSKKLTCGKFDFVTGNCLRCTTLYRSCLPIQRQQISQEHVLGREFVGTMQKAMSTCFILRFYLVNI